MPRNLVLNEGQLAEKTVVESHQPIELSQLEAEVATHQSNVDQSAAEVEAANAKHNENLAALEDSKSDLSNGQSLVATVAPAVDESSVDEGSEGASEPSEDTVAEPVVNF